MVRALLGILAILLFAGGAAVRPAPASAAEQACAGVLVPAAAGSSVCIEPGSGESFKDCPECPEMVPVPAGEFLMGSPKDEDGRSDDEDQHKVTIPEPFAVGRTHVTRDQFAKFVKATGHKTDGGCRIWTGTIWNDDENASWQSPGFSQEDNHPVVCVNWNDATAYADWLAKKTGKAYRLLTEAEAEYAARGAPKATAQPRYFFGNAAKDLCTYANGSDETADAKLGWTVDVPCRDGYVFTAPVMTFKPNAFGLYDVHGNAWTWTQDCGIWNHEIAPSNGSASLTGGCASRVIRGGSWIDSQWDLRAGARGGSNPDNRDSYVGFRMARTF